MNYINTLASQMMDMYFVLDESHSARPVCDEEWWEWYKNPENRRVAEDYLFGNTLRISTICNGLNSAISASDPPLIFETMVFVKSEIIGQRLYATWDEAIAGHQEAVAELTNAIALPDDANKFNIELES